ncbi:hypothetical protein ES708_28647 [subsurface metagenome]
MGKDKPKISNYKETIFLLANEIGKHYWFPLYHYIKDKPELIKTVTGFLLNHEQVVFYIGKTHLAIEYFGPERITKLKEKGSVQFVHHDYSLSDENFLEHIIGFEYDSTVKDLGLPLPPYSEDLILPTNAGFYKLRELKWNFSAQNSIIGLNTGNFYVLEGEFARIINGLFFHADENGLKTRHIKWIDFLPLQYDDSNPDYDTFGINISILSNLVEIDAHYVYPLPLEDDFKFSKLPQINRFIELTGNNDTTEPQITKFLAEDKNKFILTMGFLAKDIHHQVECEWQSEEKDNIIPDFFIVRPNGYADIVEFKLPYTKSKAIVGRNHRETFSAEINSYISQTRNYRTYFDDPNNRKWVKDKYGIKVHHPRKILVIGRRWDFSNDDWKEIINDYKDIEIMTYDDLVDGVIAQFYM